MGQGKVDRGLEACPIPPTPRKRGGQGGLLTRVMSVEDYSIRRNSR